MKLSFAGLSITLARERKEKAGVHGVYERHIQALLVRFPALRTYQLPTNAGVDKQALLDFYTAVLPLVYEPAREAALRSHLFLLRKKCTGNSRAQVEKEIAKSNLRSGVVERALALAEAKPEMEEFERYYGARFGYLPHLSLWGTMPGDIRGNSLAWLFKKQGIKNGTRILHFAPEKALRAFFIAEKQNKNIEYTTSDAFRDNEDLAEDITELHLEDARFDLIICHRVLEHILDDRAALREMFRVLVPGGALSVSVPQSMNRAATNEWVIPDLSHNGHLRQYGRDFEERLKEAGFAVRVESALLEKSLHDHKRDATYPMRLYTCTK